MKSKKTFLNIAILCAAIVFFGMVFYVSKQKNIVPEKPTNPSAAVAFGTTTSISTRDIPAGTKEYRSDIFHFAVLYPQELSVSEHAEGAGAATITFQNIEKGQGFQIFIVPYTGAQVSEERFKRDEPSGVRVDAKDIKIDGATASAFNSTDALLGETREVWFIRNGYLYEVTTVKLLQPLLEQIMTTWKFIDQ